MAQQPDIRVRLSPEGMAQVLGAFKRVERDGKATGRAVSLIGRELRALLPALSTAAAVAGLTALLKGALDTADGMGKMAQRVGSTSETLSVLSFAATTADVEQQKLEKGMIRLARTQDDARRGNQQAIDSFRRLGISIEDLNKIDDTGLLFVKAAEGASKFRDTGTKTAVLSRVMGRDAAGLNVLLNDLANGGFENARKRAEQLGLVISSDLANAAQRVNDAFTTIKNQVRGLAVQFLAGFAPIVADVMDDFNEDVAGKGVDSMQEFGKQVGEVVRSIVTGFRILRVTVGATMAFIDEGVRNFVQNWSTLFEGVTGTSPLLDTIKVAKNAPKLKDNFAVQAARRDAIKEALADDIAAIREDNSKPRPSIQKREREKIGLGVSEEMLKGARARLAFLQAQLDNELALFQAHSRLQEQRDQQALDQGLIGLQAFFDKRKTLAVRALDEEIRVLGEKRKIAEKAPARDEAERSRRDQELAKIDNDIRVRQVERTRVEEELVERQRKGLKELAEQRLQLDQRILESQGKRKEAALLALDEEIRKTDELLKKQGLSDSERGRITGAQRSAGTTNIEIDEQRRQADLALRDLAIERDRVNNQVAQGQMLQFQGEERIIQLERERLPVLKQIADEMLATAVTEEQIQAAREFAIAVQQIEVNINKAGREMAEFKARSFDAAQSALSDFFDNGIRDAENFGEAVRNLAFSIAESVRKIAADMLAAAVLKKILSTIGIGGSGPEQVATAAAAGTAQATPLVVASTAMTTAGGIVTSAAGALSFAASELLIAAEALAVANATGGGGAAGSAGGIASFASFFAAADGGLTGGIGGPTADKNIGLFSPGEYLVRAAAVRRPGVLQMLKAINGSGSVNIAPIHRGVPAFSDGGLNAGGATGVDSSLTATLGLEDGLVMRHIESPSGQRTLVKVLGKNKRALRAALGI
jgi:hypothetical protein